MNKRSEVIKFGKLETLLEKQKERKYSKEVMVGINELINTYYLPSPTVLCSDVFDTLLIRSEKSEIRRFYETSELLAKELSKLNGRVYSSSDLLVLRKMATKLSYSLTRKEKGIREGSLDEIYNIIVNYLGFNKTYADTLKNIEIEYEKKETSLNTPFWNFLKKMKEKGSKVVLVSDMYIHRNDIIDIIKDKVDDFEDVVHDLISSADTKINKTSGHIFNYIKKKYSAKGEEMIHFGDAFVGDYQKPNACGIRGVHLPMPSYFKELIKKDEEQVIEKLSQNNILIKSI